MDNLELYTNDELISELVSRNTFYGIVVADCDYRDETFTKDLQAICYFDSNKFSNNDVETVLGHVTKHYKLKNKKR